MRLPPLLLFVSAWLLLAPVATATTCFDVPTSAAPRELLLCGNGVLDPGEICDDGNQLDGDGCSAFCSHFDALAGAATLAGSTSACPGGRTVLGGTASNTLFCGLRAVETSLDGSYVLLGDVGTLLRFDLFTDQTQGTITQLQASVLRPFQAICSIGVLGPDGTIVVHDCGAGVFVAIMPDGTHPHVVADFSPPGGSSSSSTPLRALVRPNLKSYYDRQARTLVTAGVVVAPSEGGACVQVYSVAIPAFAGYQIQGAAVSLLAAIPCTVYGVWEGGAQLTSFDVRDMEPYLVTRERCPTTFRAGLWCYGIYMQRVAHIEFLRAFVPEDGGINLQYYASTANLFDNALGAPLIRTGGANASNGLVYTLRGACFQVEARVTTSQGKSPLPATLGNACRRAPQLGLQCALPLNNPFLTDVMTSPFLPPSGLSVTHTHGQLASIFGARCDALANVTTAGPLLYQSMLASVYGNTTPVDFVELAGTLDVVYVTPTSVGLISTKRILFQDRTQPGYARATDLIYCPSGLFGFVGGVCAPCNDPTAPGYYVSVAWQIQCAAVGVVQGGGVSAPFETFTVVSTPEITSDVLHAGACIFAETKGVGCPSPGDFSAQPPQQFNLAADALLSSDPLIGASAAAAGNNIDLIACLIASAEAATGRTLRRDNPAEFSTRVVSVGTALLDASVVRTFDPSAANFSAVDPTLARSVAAQCRTKMARGLGTFLSCYAPLIVAPSSSSAANSSSTRRRNLLQQQQQQAAQQPQALPPSTIVEHHAVALASSTPISYARVLPSSGAPPPPAPPSSGARAASDPFPLWLGIVIGLASAAALLGLSMLVCGRRRLLGFVGAPPQTQAAFAYYQPLLFSGAAGHHPPLAKRL